ncbi:MAG: ATP--guanido phosphotransferase [Planctomycetota bacterium]
MPKSPIDVHRFASRVGPWLSPLAPESDVVVSCRVRLARNVANHPFVPRLEPERATELSEQIKKQLVALQIDGDTTWVPMEEAMPVLRLVLRERHLISRDLAPGDEARVVAPGRAVAFGSSESIAVMVHEEDHLRIQSLAPGFQLDHAWHAASELDHALESRLQLSFTRELGYLTACPTNVGTGLRASVMLHLPALSLVRSELEKVFTAAQRTGLAVRGQHGEGSRAVGDYYQISNQITLGRSEEQLVLDLKALVPRIIEFERKVRAVLFKEQKAALKDRVSRSLGLLRTARAMPTESALAHLSNLRLGVHLGILADVSLETLNQLVVQVQRGHLQALNQKAAQEELIDASERDRLRAGLLRKRLAGKA